MARLSYQRTEIVIGTSGQTSALNLTNEYRPRNNIPHGITENVRVTLIAASGNLQFDNYSNSNKTVTLSHQWDYSYA